MPALFSGIARGTDWPGRARFATFSWDGTWKGVFMEGIHLAAPEVPAKR